MKKNKYWRLIFVILIVLYLIMSVGTFLFISNVSTVYMSAQKREYFQLKEDIYSAISVYDENKLKDIIEKNPLELAIYDNSKKELVFSSLPMINENNFSDLNITLNPKAVSFQEVYEVITADGQYYVWFALYHLAPQKILNFWMISFLCAVIILLTIVSIAMSVLFYKMVKPLQRFRNNILKISSYQLDRIKKNEYHSEYDTLSEELFTFAEDLQNKIDKTGVVYTSLEHNLQLQNEVMDYRSKMIASLAHDLKTPLHTIQLQLEDLTKKAHEKEVISDLNVMNSKVYKVIDDVNAMVKVAYQDNIENLQRIESFDLIKLLADTTEDFHDLFKRKKISIELSIDELILIHANKLKFKQLIHNALSNISSYASDNSEAVINCYVEEDKLILSFYNESKKLSEKDLKKAFLLFYRISNDDLGSGTGLFTIKAIADEYGGKTSLENYDKGVILSFEFDYNKIKGE